MKPFDRWHLLTPFAYFDAIAHEHEPSIDFDFARKEPHNRLCPQGGHLVKFDALAMKVVQQMMVEPCL